MAVLLLWPMGDSPGLGVKAAHFAADPRGRLPALPPPLPLGLGDDADVVALHDLQTQAYYEAYDSSSFTRMRMAVRDWTIPLAPATLRQLLIALAVLGALLVWRLAGSPEAPSSENQAE